MKRELKTLKAELLAYEKESDIWIERDGISNSAGTLVLHICGNLRHFVGAILGNTGYVRKREAEFAGQDVPRQELLSTIDETILSVVDTLHRLTDEDLQAAPVFVVGTASPAAPDFLTHLVSHLSFHLGQVNYHRRLITGQRGDVKVLEIAELKTVS